MHNNYKVKIDFQYFGVEPSSAACVCQNLTILAGEAIGAAVKFGD